MEVVSCLPLKDIYYGTTCTEVFILQKMLFASGFELAIDGIYGPKTKEAVFSFQRLAGVSGTGFEVKRSTWEALFNYEVTKNEK